jgi:hypothetical protein
MWNTAKVISPALAASRKPMSRSEASEGDKRPARTRVIHEMRDIRLGASEEIVDAQHVVSGGKQSLAKV